MRNEKRKLRHFIEMRRILVSICVCTYELREASDRKSTGSCYKLKQTDSLLVVHLFHHLQKHNFIISGRIRIRKTSSWQMCVCV